MEMVNGFNDHNNSSFGNMIFLQLNVENLVITPQDFPLRLKFQFNYKIMFFNFGNGFYWKVSLFGLLECHKDLLFLNS